MLTSGDLIIEDGILWRFLNFRESELACNKNHVLNVKFVARVEVFHYTATYHPRFVSNKKTTWLITRGNSYSKVEVKDGSYYREGDNKELKFLGVNDPIISVLNLSNDEKKFLTKRDWSQFLKCYKQNPNHAFDKLSERKREERKSCQE